ncbi:unnamed protein product [Schistosoma curassoni]|uniref:PNP_UDP_1 domain-containing protein n=1 Tax=Schistosoma curassoni TaxID=6186 RepID=A0A183K6I4_9TREM|nr:unnamed protein product [Schistosoma curassoni]
MVVQLFQSVSQLQHRTRDDRCCYLDVVVGLAYRDETVELYWLKQSFLKVLPCQTVGRRTCILGKPVRRQTKVDLNAVNELKKLSENLSSQCSVVVGGTITANDFYEEQGRLDGAICSFSQEEKLAYLKSAYDHGIRNLEMEGTAITSHCNSTGHRAILVCVAVVNRLENDQVTISADDFKLFEQLPGKLVGEYLKRNSGLIAR